MAEDVTVEMMSSDLLLWRCLHDGPLTKETVDRPEPHPQVPWDELRTRNVPLLTRLTQVYGSCAVLAQDGDRIVGQLRFYPKAVCAMTGPEPALCLQQRYPNGPSDDLVKSEFPPLDQMADRTLFVHCIMTGSPKQKDNPYQRKGIGSRMAGTLIDWARRRGWQAIEAHAYADLPSWYAVTGQAGRTFWEKLGFRVVRSVAEPALGSGGHAEFVETVMREAAVRGMDAETAKTRYTMRLDLD